MKINISTEKLDEIICKLNNLSKSIYELYSSVHTSYTSLCDEQALLIYPQTYLAVESLGKAAEKLRRINEDIDALSRIIISVPDSIASREKALEEQIDSITDVLCAVAANTAGIFLPNYCLGSESLQEEASDKTLDELLEVSSRSMEISNLSAIAVSINKEYGDDY